MVGSFPDCCPRAAIGRRRAAEQRDELASLHSITSSARASSGSGKVRRGNYRLVSSFMSAARTTLPHLSVSSAKSLPNSVGESASAVPPSSPSRALTLGSARSCIDLLVELVHDLVGRGLGCAHAPPSARLVARHELTPGRNIGQYCHARRRGHRKRA